MFSGNGYPLGSTYDPNAPWNRNEHTCTKKVDVFIKLFATIEVEVDEDGDILSDLKDEAEEQLEDIIQRGAYQLEEVEVD